MFATCSLQGIDLHVCSLRMQMLKRPGVNDKHIKLSPTIYLVFVIKLDDNCTAVKYRTLYMLRRFLVAAMFLDSLGRD